MINITISGEGRTLYEASRKWIDQRIAGLRQKGLPVSVQVAIDESRLNIFLSSAGIHPEERAHKRVTLRIKGKTERCRGEKELIAGTRGREEGNGLENAGVLRNPWNDLRLSSDAECAAVQHFNNGTAIRNAFLYDVKQCLYARKGGYH